MTMHTKDAPTMPATLPVPVAPCPDCKGLGLVDDPAHSRPTRPVLRYHGGKWNLAPWILQHLPAHRIYVEPFMGACSVLLRKPRAYSECVNDLDGEIVNVFRVLRCPDLANDLENLLYLTPFAREEFEESYEPVTLRDGEVLDMVEMARRTIARSFMGFGSQSATSKTAAARGFRPGTVYYTRKPDTGFRNNANRSGTVPAHDWANYPGHIEFFTERLRGVVIENRDAIGLIVQMDSPGTLYYCDPPYVLQTRDSGSDYRYEMTEDQHRRLAEVLRSVEGMVVLSGYPCPLYDVDLYPDWHRVERAALADGARKRTEVLWLNPRAAASMPQGRLW